MGQQTEYLHLLHPKEPAVSVASGELHNMPKDLHYRTNAKNELYKWQSDMAWIL